MTKKNLIMSIICLLLAVYVLFAGKLYSGRQHQALCQAVDILVEDSVEHPYVHAAEIRQLLLVNHIKIKDTPVDGIDLSAIEQAVEKHPLVKNAECFVSPSGRVCLKIAQRVPILRILSGNEKYFMDEEGRQMSIPVLAVVDVPVVTGEINRRDTALMSRLYEMAGFLRRDAFWNAMVEQIVVKNNAEWILYPRVGDFEICLGKAENLAYKMQSLKCFYEDALPKVGWNRYSRVSLEYDNQIICIKK